MSKPVQFTLDTTPLTPAEIQLFHADLVALGLDEQVILLLNRMPLTASRVSIPKVLRGYCEGQLSAVAWIMECRASFHHILPGWFGKFMDMPRFPIFFWGRCDMAIDSFNNPGFVANGLSRADFFEQAVQFLTRRYMNGLVIQKRDDFRLPWAFSTPFVDSGYITGGGDLAEDHLAQRRNLRRKIKKFANKGGRIEIIQGAPPAEIRPDLVRCLSNAEQNARARIAFQDIYNPLAISNLMAPGLRTVHFIAFLEEKIAGYQSFLQAGDELHCLSGGFDRSFYSTYHAYENIIWESIQYAQTSGINTINYGPVFNPSKAAMMQSFQPAEIHFYTRHAWLRRSIPGIIRRSTLHPQNLAAFRDLAGRGVERLADVGGA